MLTKAEIQEILQAALSSGGDFAELFEETTDKHQLKMTDGKVEDVNSGIVQGVGLRIYAGLRSVYAYTNDLTLRSLRETAEKLSQSLEGDGNGKKVFPKELQEVVYENRHPVKRPFSQVSSQEKIQLMRRADAAARGFDPVIQKVILQYQDECQKVAISNSEGKYIQDTRFRTRLRIQAVAYEDGLMQDGSQAPGASMGFEFYDQIDVEAAAREAARIAKTMLHAKDCPSGEMTVVLDNGFGGVIFHEACGHSLEATGVAKGTSVFSGKLGQRIASELVNAVDDGTIPYAWGSSNIDDEGNFTKRNVLIENGILKGYLIDTLNGRRMEMPSTGSGRRESYRFEPTSRMTNTFLENGTSTFEEILAATPYGLYAKKLGGGSVNTSTGDFNFAVKEAYLIRDGKIAEPVKGATLVGNGSQILFKIDRIANNCAREQGMCGSKSGSIPADVGQPTIRVSSMTVGGQGGENGEKA